ncbi:fasciclin domain-containing protein [Agriterribacter sp.]|uniref:fasciclin domain-containing protein n=1 Tax=Agriterribacter sp. TaxID=2821509 RepID=UPI002D1DF5A3|nr:fasciclin domain-containing protein [Agriterribacter sp.]HRP54999.1 fasciclin domain-containing protein [Agriterribacter sp.]
MKKNYLPFAALLTGTVLWLACANDPAGTTKAPSAATGSAAVQSGQSAVQDDESRKDVVKTAMVSADHTTLVKALQAAGYVDALSNAGPFTVFAPVNAAFDKLPAGTLAALLKPEKKDDLRNILEYHVYIGVLKPETLTDGQTFGQANGNNISITVKDGKTMVNGASITASVPVSNGIIHVVDAVLLPPEK